MTIDTPHIIAGIVIVLVAGAIIAVIRHIGNGSKHPCKRDIVFKDTCEAEMKGLRDCVEVKFEALQKGIDLIVRLIKNDGKE